MKFRYDDYGNNMTHVKHSRVYKFNKELTEAGFVQGIDYAFRECDDRYIELVCKNPKVKEYLKK